MTETMKLTAKDVVETYKVISAELGAYIRHTFQVFIQWFIFFCTSNYLALGVVATIIAKSEFKNPGPIIAICFFFSAQTFLGIAACNRTLRNIQEKSTHIQSANDEFKRWLSENSSPLNFVADSPADYYIGAVKLTKYATALLIPCWAALAIGAIYI